MKLYKGDDLSRLTHVKAKDVLAFVEDLNAVPIRELRDQKLVVAVGTGGTISMKTDTKGILQPDLDFGEIIGRADNGLKEKFLIKGFDAFKIPSPQMDYSHARDLAIIMSYLWNHAQIAFAGFLVLHGTDTMTYSAAAISLMMGQGLQFSIVYTGSQKPIQEPLSDAGDNIRNALYTLEALYDNNMAEVVITIGDFAVLATAAEKIDATQANAFGAPLHKYVTRFDRLEYPVKLASWLKPRRAQPFEPKVWDGLYGHTLVIKSHLGMNPEIIVAQLTDKQIKAVVLYSYATGSVNSQLIDTIMPIIKKRRICAFAISPVNAELKEAYAATRYMIDKGVTPLYMTLSAALAKIELSLRLFPKSTKEAAKFMVENYVGEIPNENSRYIAEK